MLQVINRPPVQGRRRHKKTRSRIEVLTVFTFNYRLRNAKRGKQELESVRGQSVESLLCPRIIKSQALTAMACHNIYRIRGEESRGQMELASGTVKPLAAAGLDVREILIYFMQISLCHFTS